MTHFCQTLNFGHQVWALGVAFELYDIRGSERIVGGPPSSSDVVIGPLLSLGGGGGEKRGGRESQRRATREGEGKAAEGESEDPRENGGEEGEEKASKVVTRYYF